MCLNLIPHSASKEFNGDNVPDVKINERGLESTIYWIATAELKHKNSNFMFLGISFT